MLLLAKRYKKKKNAKKYFLILPFGFHLFVERQMIFLFGRSLIFSFSFALTKARIIKNCGKVKSEEKEEENELRLNHFFPADSAVEKRES